MISQNILNKLESISNDLVKLCAEDCNNCKINNSCKNCYKTNVCDKYNRFMTMSNIN